VCLIVVAAFLTAAAHGADEKLLEPDGTRSNPVHRIFLYDAEGNKITLAGDPVLPFSTRQTCGKCHDYKKIQKGLHFNTTDPDVKSGRAGEPWILFEPKTGTQIPISSRRRPGTFKPETLGLKPWRFVRVFGRHMTGGGYGEKAGPKERGARWEVTGQLEINCLACHSADPAQDPNEWAVQIGQQNFMWAATAAGGLAVVKGAAATVPDSYDPFMESDEGGKGPKVHYDKSRFDANGRVLFNVTRDISPSRCYACHTVKQAGPGSPERWQVDPNIHIAAGMSCVDCHRNGLDHNMNRGYPGQPAAATQPALDSLTCRGCHMGQDARTGRKVLGGRFAAPYPQHKGLPTVHLDKLTCTTCHSGPMPQQTVGRVQTSRSHRLGIHGMYRGKDSPPYILSPVYMRRADGKIGPHRMVFTSFWGRMRSGRTDEGNGALEPIPPGRILELVGEILKREPSKDRPDATGYQRLITKQIHAAQKTLSENKTWGQVAYFGGQPYAWPLAHEVRPARQALGAGGCEDCHSTKSPFFFGAVPTLALADMPKAKYVPEYTPMVEFLGLDADEVAYFAEAFRFRSTLKTLSFIATGVVGAVLLLYGLRGLGAITKRFGERARRGGSG